MPGIKEVMPGDAPNPNQTSSMISGAEMNRLIPVMIGLRTDTCPQIRQAPTHHAEDAEDQPAQRLLPPIRVCE